MLNLFFWRKPKKSLTVLYVMAFFLSLSGALPAYIQSSYIESYAGISAVNWFFIAANLVSLFAILVFPKLIKRYGNYLTTGIIALLFLISLSVLGFTTNPVLIFFFFILMQIAIYLIWINMDIFVKEFSDNATTGETRGVYFTIINFAWIISPTISSWIIGLSGYYGVFLSSALLLFPFLLIFYLKGSQIYSKQKYKVSLIKSAKAMFKNKNLGSVFWLATLLNVFFSVAVITVPIYLHHYLHFSWPEIGIIFSIMLIPFLIVEIPAGFIADKYIGEKEMFALGFLIVIVCLAIFSTSSSENIWFWAVILFISRIGAALIEAMREAYFFKKVSCQDLDKINIFRASLPLGYLIGSFISIATLSIWPIQYIFITTAVFTCSAFPFILIMKDTK